MPEASRLKNIDCFRVIHVDDSLLLNRGELLVGELLCGECAQTGHQPRPVPGFPDYDTHCRRSDLLSTHMADHQ
jgi:hypothetical protein